MSSSRKRLKSFFLANHKFLGKEYTMVLRRKYGLRARRLLRRKRIIRRVRPMRMLRRVGNPTPTFTETYKPSPDFVDAGGQLFTGNIGGLPQYAQYANLYNQYRINWVKVLLIADYNTAASDVNQALANGNALPPIGSFGMTRIAWSIQNTPLANPAAGVPATEDVVLRDNGCKIKPLTTKWSCSFKPVVASEITSGVGPTSLAKQKYRPFLNFTGNPLTEAYHYGVQAFITQVNFIQPAIRYNVYYKINFTLRDPK